MDGRAREFLGVAERAAREAGRVLLSLHGSPLDYGIKEDSRDRPQIVTRADIEAENTIKEIILGEYPDHFFLGEESTSGSPGSGFTWLVDPLCGTKAFVRGSWDFSVSIALAREGRVLVGVVYAPLLDRLYWAVEGEGAFLGDERISVSRTGSLVDAIVSIEHRAFRTTENSRAAIDLSRRAFGMRCGATCGLEMALVASGVTDCLVKTSQPAYEYAAGLLLVMEAGGLVTDHSGRPIDTPRIGGLVDFVACTPGVHGEVVDVLSRSHQPL